MSVNTLENIFVGQLVNTLQGPIVQSQVFDEKSMTYLDVYTWEVYNGARLVEPLPFGMFGRIEPMNTNKCKLEIRVAPGYYDEPSAPVFQEICTGDRAVNAQLISSVVCRKVVPLASDPEKGAGIWESTIEPIDSTHGMRITRHDPVIFQQRSVTLTREDTIPQRFKAEIATKEVTEVVMGDIGSPSMQLGDQLRSEQQITPNTKQITVRTLDTVTSSMLLGSQAYEEGVKSSVIELLVNFQPEAETGLQIISSEVIGLGNGRWVRETHTAPTPWPVFKGSRFDDTLNSAVGFTEQFVSPPVSTTSEANTEYEPVNADRSLKRVRVVPTAVLDNYIITYPVRVNLQLPRVLKSLSVIWNGASESGDQSASWSGSSAGKSYSLSCNLSDGSSSSVGLVPEVLVEIQEIWSSNLPAQAKVFFMKLPITEAQVLTRLGASRWPVFKPRSHTIVACGAKAGCSVRVSVSASSSGSESNTSKDAGSTTSTSKDVSLSNNVIQLPPTIHGAINITGELTKNLTATANGALTVSGFNFPSVSVNKTELVTAAGFVSPVSFPATPGVSAIPTSGMYLVDCRVEPYKWGYARVYAEVLNANVLA